MVSAANIKNTKKIVDLISHLNKDDLVICLISGGGSAMFEWPIFSLKKTVGIYKKLINSGALIDEINIIRKNISQVKGGKLAKIIYPAQCVSLVISDVMGNDLSTIASGPTALDKSTISQAQKIARKYKIKIDKFEPTPKNKKYFKNVKNIILLDNLITVKVMSKKCKGRILTTKIKSEARQVGQKMIKYLPKRGCLIAAGEPFVKIKGDGKGGRCTEAALGFLKQVPKDMVFCAVSSDGVDNTKAAGAIIDYQTKLKAQKLVLSIDKYLKDNNSFNFFRKTGDLIFTGPTGTNVADLFLMIRE